MSIFAKYISQLFYFHPQIFFRTDSCTSFKKSFEYAGHCLRGVYKNGLICTFVRAGLRWTSNSHLPLLFLIFFMSRKFKHFSPFSSSMANWMCLSCLFKIFWNSHYNNSNDNNNNNNNNNNDNTNKKQTITFPWIPKMGPKIKKEIQKFRFRVDFKRTLT